MIDSVDSAVGMGNGMDVVFRAQAGFFSSVLIRLGQVRQDLLTRDCPPLA